MHRLEFQRSQEPVVHCTKGSLSCTPPRVIQTDRELPQTERLFMRRIGHDYNNRTTRRGRLLPSSINLRPPPEGRGRKFYDG